MTKDTMIGVDLAKTVLQLHGASMTGELKFRKKLSRGSFAKFMAEQPPAVIVMEACGSAHYWAREMSRYGHCGFRINGTAIPVNPGQSFH
ncbi:hypothetical protein LJR238_004841 [Pararhizobium sp. LjRoot238]